MDENRIKTKAKRRANEANRRAIERRTKPLDYGIIREYSVGKVQAQNNPMPVNIGFVFAKFCFLKILISTWRIFSGYGWIDFWRNNRDLQAILSGISSDILAHMF
jgi:hypothetical protein